MAARRFSVLIKRFIQFLLRKDSTTLLPGGLRLRHKKSPAKAGLICRFYMGVHAFGAHPGIQSLKSAYFLTGVITASTMWITPLVAITSD